jgi:hypothetical protein
MIEITPEMIAAWRRKDRNTLERLLGLKPWQCNPIDADDGPAPWGPGSAGNASWPAAQKMRKALQAAAKQSPNSRAACIASATT